MEPRVAALARLVEIIDRLRDGCPWDREQTLESMVPCVQEETAELSDAVAHEDPALVREELGDLLMNVFLMSRIGEQAGTFSLGEVAAEIADKLVRRHPHVFGSVRVSGAEEALQSWDRVKAEEQAASGARRSRMDGIPVEVSALRRATKTCQRAAAAGFDWPDARTAFAHVEEEAREAVAALATGTEPLEAEVGDLLFAVAGACRRAGLDPDLALRRACSRFERRFRHLEERLGERWADSTAQEKERLWREAKEREAAG